MCSMAWFTLPSTASCVRKMMSAPLDARRLLDHRTDGNRAVGQDARDVGQHAGLVVDPMRR